MAIPSDHVAGEGNPQDPSKISKPLIRKAPIIDPGFREEVQPIVSRPKILGIKKPSDPNDLRNLKFLVMAFLLALVIFVILEYKQFREAAREAKHSAMEFMRAQ